MCWVLVVALGVFTVTSSIFCYSVWTLVVASRFSCPKACGILVSHPGIEPVSPELEDGFITTGLPGKSLLKV